MTDTKGEILLLLGSPHLTEAIRIEIAKLIEKKLCEAGTFYYDEETDKVYYKNYGKLLNIDKDDFIFKSYLNENFSINPSSSLLYTVSSHLRSRALFAAKRVIIRKISYSSATNKIVLVHAGGDRVYKISIDSITEIANGDEGVLFVDKDKRHFQLVTDHTDEVDHLKKYFLDLFKFKNDPMPSQLQSMLLMLLIILPYFFDWVTIAPFFLFVSEKNSGKTTLMRTIGKLIHSSSFDIKLINKEDSFVAEVTSGNLLGFFDDANRFVDWLEQRIVECVTGGDVTFRELYTTNNLVKYKMRSLLAFSAIEFKNKRSDLVSRCIPLSLEIPEKRTPEGKILDEINTNYNEIMSNIVGLIQHVLKCWNDVPVANIDIKTDFRFVSVAKILFILTGMNQNHFDELLKSIHRAQHNMITGSDPLYLLIDEWLEMDKNMGREVTAKELFHDLRTIAQASGIAKSWRIYNSQQLGSRLFALWSDLTTEYNVTKRKAAKNVTKYKFEVKA